MARTKILADDDPEWQPAEPNWDVYRSDLKPSKMVIQRVRPVMNFDIPILPQAPRYNPASAPVSEPVILHLDNDAHLDENKRAFIVDKVILPLEPFTELDDPRQRRAYYIIGWPDLPSARPVVDCMQASEYVSPHVIEEWEYQAFLRREEEKEAAEAEAAIAAVAAAIAAEKGKSIAGVDSRILPNGKKKPGRKPKNARLLEARAPTPQLDSEQEEMLAKRKKGPSLSTPQKSRIAQLDAELEMDLLESMDDSMDDGGDMEELLQRQMESETRSEIADSMDEAEDEMDPLVPSTTASRILKDEPEDFSSFLVSSRPPMSRNLHQNLASSSSGSKSTNPPVLSPFQQQQQQHRPSIPQRPHISAPSSRLAQHTERLSPTPIPVPTRPSWPSKTKPSSSPAQTVVPSIEKGSSLYGRAPMTKPTTAVPDHQPPMAHWPSSSIRPSSSGENGFTPTNSFTPAGGYVPRPPKRSAEDSKEITPSHAKGHPERRKKAAKLSQSPPEAEPEQEFRVKRLEGDEIIDGVQCFKVRWEGDWPADQNPTWEPEQNISDKLVKGYLKRKGERAARKQAKNTPIKGATGSSRGRVPGSTAKAKGQRQSTLLDWANQHNYGSVSDAFEGNAELEQINGEQSNRAQNDDDDELAGDVNEFLIVDNKRTADEREREAAERRKSLSAQLAANLANM